MYRGRDLPAEDVEALKAGAEVLQNSKVLHLLLLDVEFLAQKLMFEKASTYDDMMFGKAILYTVDILKKKIDNLAK